MKKLLALFLLTICANGNGAENSIENEYFNITKHRFGLSLNVSNVLLNDGLSYIGDFHRDNKGYGLYINKYEKGDYKRVKTMCCSKSSSPKFVNVPNQLFFLTTRYRAAGRLEFIKWSVNGKKLNSITLDTTYHLYSHGKKNVYKIDKDGEKMIVKTPDGFSVINLSTFLIEQTFPFSSESEPHITSFDSKTNRIIYTLLSKRNSRYLYYADLPNDTKNQVFDIPVSGSPYEAIWSTNNNDLVTLNIGKYGLSELDLTKPRSEIFVRYFSLLKKDGPIQSFIEFENTVYILQEKAFSSYSLASFKQKTYLNIHDIYPDHGNGEKFLYFIHKPNSDEFSLASTNSFITTLSLKGSKR